MDLDKVVKVAGELVKIMSLQDWTISIDILDKEEFIEAGGAEDELGFNMYVPSYFLSDICINKEYVSDWYETLVHELYHLKVRESIDFSKMLIQQHKGRTKKTYKDKIKELEERLVSQMTSIFVSVYPQSNFDEILQPKVTAYIEYNGNN